MNPVILHAAKCTLMFPQTEPPPPHCPSLSFSVSLIPLYFLKLQPYVWGDPRFKRAPWETTPLSAIDFKLQVYEEREQSFREGRWRRVEGEMGRLKKIETDEVKRGELSMCVCMHVHVRVCACIAPPPPCSRLNPREDWLPSKDNLSQTLESTPHPFFSSPPPIHLILLSFLSPLSHPCLSSLPFALPVAVTSPSCLSTPKPSAPCFSTFPTSSMICFLHLDTHLYRGSAKSIVQIPHFT